MAEMTKISPMTSPTRGDSMMNVQGKDTHTRARVRADGFPHHFFFFAANVHIHLKEVIDGCIVF